MAKKGSKSGKKRSKSSSAGGKSAKSKERSQSASVVRAEQKEVDILSPVAMFNAQFICHNAVDCLEKRGFQWDGAKKKKKKKK